MKTHAFLVALVFVCVLLCSGSLFAENEPGFDCSKAKTEIEKLICSSDELTGLDSRLSGIYSELMSALDKNGKAELKASQIEWLKKRALLVQETILPADSPEVIQIKKKKNLKNVYGARLSDIKKRLETLTSKESQILASNEKSGMVSKAAESNEEKNKNAVRPKLIMEELYALGRIGGNYDERMSFSTNDTNYKLLWEKVLAVMGISKERLISGAGHYDTALEILGQIRTGLAENSDYQKTWAENQERVFSAGYAADKDTPPIEPTGLNLPKRAHGDFLYQSASWHFYKGEYDKALEIYRKIEKIKDAPIRGYASYMVMRILNNSGKKAEAYELSEKILSDNALKYVHVLTANYRFVIMYYDGPPEASEKHLRWLSGIVRVNPASASELELRVSDYYDALEQLASYLLLYAPQTYSVDWWLIDEPGMPENGRQAAFSPGMQSVIKVASKDELIDWMQSLTAYNVFATDWLWALHEQDNAYWKQNRKIVTHAWNRWKKGDGGEWLQIAAQRVHPEDELAAEILKASMPFFSAEWKKETKHYKNWLFELWENDIRILIGRNEFREAMSLISNHHDFGSLPYYRWSWNDSSRHAECLSKVLRWLVYTGQTDSARECLSKILYKYPNSFKEWQALLAKSWEEMPLSYHNEYNCTLWDGIINVLPTKALYDLADNQDVPESERALFIRSAFTRAIILGYGNDILEKYAVLAAKLHPSIKEQIISSVANHDRNDCIDLLLRMPRFRPVPNKGGRDVNIDENAMKNMTAIDVYNHNDNNWWCRYEFKSAEEQIIGLAIIIPETFNTDMFRTSGKDNIEFKPYIEKQKSFLSLHPYNKMIDMNEIAALEAVPAAPQFLSEAVIERESRFYWKFWQSEKTRNKHAANLHYAVRTTRYGCDRCGSHTAYSKKAYRILHKQYGKTTWAKITPYWFK